MLRLRLTLKGGIELKYTVETIRKISYEIGEGYRGKIANLGGVVISTAYALVKIQQSSSINVESFDSFLDGINESETISSILSRNLEGLWENVVGNIGKYDTEILKAVVLYDNTFLEMSTPTSINKLANRILNITEQDSVLDICSGYASFPAHAYLEGKTINEYTGIEINYNANDIAVLRASLLGKKYTFILNNALTYQFSKSIDKIFSNYPFGLKGSDLDNSRRELQNYYDMNGSVTRCSSDWLFNAIIVRNLSHTGKAVAIMSNGAAYNKPDLYMRQFFAENGYIEAVINLPPALFVEFSIPTTMIIFSHNNSFIRLINAENIFSKESRRLNTLSDENIQTILGCLDRGGVNTVDLTPADMREHDYNLMASHYLEKPIVENGVCFDSVIKSITRGAQVKPEILESFKAVMPTHFRYVNLSNISNGSIEIEDGQQFITELPKALERFVIPNDAIVLSKMASPTFRSAVVNTGNDFTMVATGNLYIIEIDESKANPYYIQAFFDSELGEATLNYSSGGTMVKTISAEAVKNLIIPLPSLEEQNRIALKYQAALDEYTILKRKLQRVLNKKRTLLDSRE